MLNRFFFVILLVAFLGCNQDKNTNSDYFEDTDPPSTNLFFGDPYILLDGDTYYAYGTGQESDTGIEVYKSDDLLEWEGPVGASDGFALHQDDVYGEQWFWAPEVYEIDGQYYMFFSVQEHMAIAVSDSPEGPFVQDDPSVLRDQKSIDHHLFVDDDGTRYLYFANFKDGLEIWGAELRDDFSSIKEETLTKIMEPSQNWEKSEKEPVGRVNEGPYILKKDGKYYMTYSANHYASPDYGIGIAFADEPLGEWTKSEQNPLIQNPDDLVGTGHNSLFRDTEGKLHIVYHTHNSTEEVHPRKVFFNEVRFVESDGEAPHTLEVLSPRYEPKVVPESE